MHLARLHQKHSSLAAAAAAAGGAEAMTQSTQTATDAATVSAPTAPAAVATPATSAPRPNNAPLSGQYATLCLVLSFDPTVILGPSFVKNFVLNYSNKF